MIKKSPPPMPMLWALKRLMQSSVAMEASTADPFFFRISLETILSQWDG